MALYELEVEPEKAKEEEQATEEQEKADITSLELGKCGFCCGTCLTYINGNCSGCVK